MDEIAEHSRDSFEELFEGPLSPVTASPSPLSPLSLLPPLSPLSPLTASPSPTLPHFTPPAALDYLPAPASNSETDLHDLVSSNSLFLPPTPGYESSREQGEGEGAAHAPLMVEILPGCPPVAVNITRWMQEFPEDFILPDETTSRSPTPPIAPDYAPLPAYPGRTPEQLRQLATPSFPDGPAPEQTPEDFLLWVEEYVPPSLHALASASPSISTNAEFATQVFNGLPYPALPGVVLSDDELFGRSIDVLQRLGYWD